ncbi:hypothetical protein TNCV_2823161 [Trichonephila clavipes]|nr:hypothetical protein TNCV_2823161 [Trichonephila clavipes]
MAKTFRSVTTPSTGKKSNQKSSESFDATVTTHTLNITRNISGQYEKEEEKSIRRDTDTCKVIFMDFDVSAQIE